MAKFYSSEKSAQVVISLLKEHGIRKVIASPGSANMVIVASMQNDTYFEMYSSVDERSAAYMACGLAEESSEPVIICCTGATASRNYLPGLTEAYYRKLPILSITGSQSVAKVGHHIAQVIDRSSMPNDVLKLSVTLPIVKDDEDLWECEVKMNQAILELTRHGGGPVHINYQTTYSKLYNTKVLPKFQKINRIAQNDVFPELPAGKIAVFIGSHIQMPKEQSDVIDQFCAYNNAVVFCDHTSGYKGRYRLLHSLVACQQVRNLEEFRPNVLIHIGEISGDYSSLRISGKQIWRVNEDGEIRDTFGKLRYVFEMPEETFFKHYTKDKTKQEDSFLNSCKAEFNELYNKIPELPFSNIWIASKMAYQLPENSTIHFGILNSLRSWNFFEIPNSVNSASSVGGFGIDGGVSSLVGASLANKNKLFFGVIGDLAFFYDMNVMGNRHVGKNLRILLVNNGKGTEFRQFNHNAAHFGNDTDEYIAAAGHFGNKSQVLVKNYAEGLGFEYLSASGKEGFNEVSRRFLKEEITDRPILLEVFTNSEEESQALESIMNINENVTGKAKQLAKQVLGENSLNILKNALRK